MPEKKAKVKRWAFSISLKIRFVGVFGFSNNTPISVYDSLMLSRTLSGPFNVPPLETGWATNADHPQWRP